MRLEFVGERRRELLQFRPDDRGTVGPTGMIHVVILMILFRRVEGRERYDRRDDRHPECARSLKLPLGKLGRLPLLWGVVENDRTVLRSDVGALAVRCGRVVRVPEDVQQFRVGDHGRVESDLDDLGVPGCAGADPLVSGILNGAAAVPANRGLHPDQLLKLGLG
jgi:hypothetical protein